MGGDPSTLYGIDAHPARQFKVAIRFRNKPLIRRLLACHDERTLLSRGYWSHSEIALVLRKTTGPIELVRAIIRSGAVDSAQLGAFNRACSADWCTW
jgi:hypothetical protein